jgi:hypothetical protein
MEDLRVREINEKLSKVINEIRKFGHYFSKVRPLEAYQNKYHDREIPVVFTNPY